MKIIDGRLEHKDPEGDILTADFYQNDGKPSTGFLIIGVSPPGKAGAAMRMSRKQARKFALAILSETERQ